MFTWSNKEDFYQFQLHFCDPTEKLNESIKLENRINQSNWSKRSIQKANRQVPVISAKDI